MWGLCTFLVYWRVHFREDKELRRGFKGENGMWEIPEGLIYGWFYVWPIMITCSYFFKWPIDDKIWGFLEGILYVALGVRGAMEGAKIIKRGSGSYSSSSSVESESTAADGSGTIKSKTTSVTSEEKKAPEPENPPAG